MTNLSFGATEFDNAVVDSGIVHEAISDTDHNDSSILKQGYPYGSFDVISPTPVHVWPFHEDGGSTAYDLAGSLNGSINGATVGQPGILGTTAYSLDGSDDNVQINSVTQYSTATITAWVNLSSADSGARVVYLGTNYGPWVMAVGGSDGTQWQTFAQTGGEFTGFFGGSAVTGEWTYLAATINTDNSLRLYQDGAQVEAESISGSHNTQGSNDRIGEDGQGGSNVAASIGEVRFYDQELTESQIGDLHDVAATRGDLVTDSKVA